MSKTLQFRRGTTSQLSTISGAIGELFVDTTKDTVVVMDGSTAGGFPLASEALLTSVQSSLQSSINAKANSSSLATVATSGSYNDLTNKPNIPVVPTNISAFANDVNYATFSDINQALTSKQDTLVSGSNIKSINGQSILGSGNLVITGDGSVLDTSAFATKTDLLILDSDDIDEGLINQYYTNQKVANVLLNGTHTNISFAYNGSALSASVSLPATSGDTFDTLNIQQSETVIGTVTSKSIIPPTTQFVEYVSNGNNSSTNPIYAILNFDHGYFYSSYANIYSPSNNTKIRELFATGNIVRIAKSQYWWDLQITGNDGGNSTTYFNPYYTVIGSNNTNGWSGPDGFDPYYPWDQDISFSTNLPIAQKYVLTLNNPATILGASDKLLFNGDLTDTPYTLNVTNRGTWDISITNSVTDQVIFGSNSYYANQDAIKELLQVGTTVTISDNVWGQTGTYLVTGVGADTAWTSTYGFSVQFQYVSGTNYSQQYTSLASLFNSYLASISGIVTPNYTTKYKSSNFSTLNNTSYVSFNNYDFINIGDEVSYIPGIASIQFKDDAGNNVKAISYNNSTGEMVYEGLPDSPIIYLGSNQNTFSGVAYKADEPGDGNSPRNSNVTNSISIGKNSGDGGSNAISIGNDAKAQSQSTVVGVNSRASGNSISIGNSTESGQVNSFGIAIGSNVRAPGYKHINIGASDIASSYPYYALPNLYYRQNYRRSTTAFVMQRAGIAYIYTSFGGSILQHSASVQDFNLREWLNMNVNTMARIKLNWHISSESYSTLLTYYAKGGSEYLYSPNSPNSTKLVNIGTDTTVFGTDTYANELNITLENSTNTSSRQMMKFVSNASDTMNRRIIIDLEATFS